MLLYLLQAPLAYRMARRLRAAQEERERLLLGILAASDRERPRIAADLHDGVVQGLAGTTFTLAAEADRAQPADPAAAGPMRSAARDLRRWVRELRSLLVTMSRRRCAPRACRSSLTDLVASLEGRGIAVTVSVDVAGRARRDERGPPYRVAQEAVRNVVRHAGARHVVGCGRPGTATTTDAHPHATTAGGSTPATPAGTAASGSSSSAAGAVPWAG